MAEIKLGNTDFLVSETDENGKIVFANEDFVKISGYSLEELLGKPHNIVRHQDMPKEAFSDLWSTVKNGKRWKGYVKNKSKNGDYYWVYSTVYPVTNCQGKKGFISCRKYVSQQEIDKYEEIYKNMR
jgi:aerotaxis receptor